MKTVPNLTWRAVARFLIAAGSLAVSVPSCGAGSSKSACTPGASSSCTGPGGCAGGQVCNSDGSGYGTCDCGSGGSGSSGGAGTDGTDAGSGGGLESFSAYCIAANNAWCARLYQCEGASFPGTVASCEAKPDANCGSKTCPSGTTFNSAGAAACVTAWQNELCANAEAPDAPTGCTTNAVASNVCM